ncbi:MAG: OmpA family protein [Flavobacteriales bacterium]
MKDGASNVFYWYSSGTVSLMRTGTDGVSKTVATAESGFTFKNDEYHTLKVKSFSNRCEMYVDDKLVLKTEKQPFHFNAGVGAYVNQNGNLSVDHIKVYQEREAINLVEADFKLTKKENLGTAVNTFYHEVQPIISHDGGTLYFTRKDYPKNTNGIKDDIWVSKKGDDGVFATSTNAGKPVNNSDYNAVAGFSADGKKMVVFGKYTESGASAGEGFCEFTWDGNNWGNPKNLEIQNFYNLNDYQEASYSPDGNVVIMTVERRDTYGEKDVYVSLKQTDGTWLAPFNAGNVINSFADETSPFLAGDNKTLYFASEGLSGYGSSDVFMTRRLDDTWKNWSKPVNLGPAINSADWDAYFTIDSKGEYAYMVSTHHSVGKSDIFKFQIPKELRPDSVAAAEVLTHIIQKDSTYFTKHETQYDSTTIITHVETTLQKTDTIVENKLVYKKELIRLHGKVYDAETGAQLPAEIVIKEIEKDREIKRISHDASGFDTQVEEGYNYGISADYNGYIAEKVNVDLTSANDKSEKEVKILLKKIKKEQTIELHNIFFDGSSTTMRFDSRGELAHVADLMQKYPKMKILIGGHTSFNQADAKFNRKVSTERAKAVYSELIKLGVDKKRLQFKGFGHDKPAYDVNSLWENAKNRRVDFTIIEL